MPNKVQYFKSVDFLNGFSKPLFRQEIEAEPTLSPIFIGIADGKGTLTDIDANNIDGVQVWVKRALTGGEQTDLDDVVQNHDPISNPPPAPNPDDQDAGSHAPTHLSTGSDSIPIFQGATAGTTGLDGLVPVPSAGQENFILHGDGTFRNPSGVTIQRASQIVFSGHPTGGVNVASIDDIPGFKINDAGGDKGVKFAFRLTPRINLSTNPRVLFSGYQFAKSSNVANDSIVFGMEARYIADGELAGQAIAETATLTKTFPLDPSDAANDGQQISGEFLLNNALMINSDMILVVIKRIATDPADTFNSILLFGQYGTIEFGVP